LRRELALLCCGVQFLTRLPVSARLEWPAGGIGRVARYFPLVGQLVGAICAAVLLLAAQFWSGFIAAVLALLAGALLTGALHEDGLADTADGLAGGRDAAQRLAIMKDSRVGSYGVLALGFCTLLKLGSLAALPPWGAAVALLAAHGVARAAAVLVMRVLPYAGDPASAKIAFKQMPPTRGEALLAVVLASWPLLLLSGTQVGLGLAFCAVLTLAVAYVAQRLIGGQRGDVLGAVEQLCEVGFLLGCAARLH
jgi:adenosylcobinamide-GDP ribazoletransferase